MARRKYEEEHDNHERWLVSYADFITLLFAFFVVMYAISSVNAGKYRVLADALGGAFRNTPVLPAVGPGEPAALSAPRLDPLRRHSEALRREREHMTRMARDILKALAPLVDQGKVSVTQSPRGVRVEINASVLFAPGDAKLSEQTSQVMRAVAAVLKDDDHAIQVEGHTDNVPINNSAFASNWDLSAVRAAGVVRLFVENGVAEKRLTAIGRGATRPVAENGTPEGRLRNRRVSVIILSGLPEPVTQVPLEGASAPR